MSVFEKINSDGSSSSTGGGVFNRLKKENDTRNQVSYEQGVQKFGAPNLDPSNSELMQTIKNQPASQPTEKQLTNQDRFKNYPSRKIPIIGSVLKALDAISSNKALIKVGDVGRALYTPGGGAANVAGLLGGVEKGIAKVAPNLVGNVAGRVAQKVATGAATGFPIGVGGSLAQGQDDKQALEGGVFGSLLGGGFGALGGLGSELASQIKKDRLSATFDKMFPAYEQAAANRNVREYSTTKPQPQQAGPVLGLPEPKSVIMERELNRRSVLPANTDVIHGQGNLMKAEPLGLPIGNFTAPMRLKVNNPTETLDYVMTKIKPQVMAIIEAPERRDLLIQYLNKNGYEMNDIINRPLKELQEHGALVEENLRGNMQQIAFDVAKQNGHDLPALLEGQAPSLRAQLAKDTQSQVYGVQPPKIEIQKPKFNVQHVSDAAMPETKISFNSTKSKPVEVTEPVAPITPEPVKGTGPIDAEIPGPSKTPNAPNKKFTPKQILENDQIERGFVTTLKNSDKPPAEFKELLKSAYTPITNESTVQAANKIINKDLEAAASYVLGKSQFNATKVTTAHRLIDEFTKSGNHQRAVDIAEKIAEEGTKAGQSIQAFSIYNRLSKEGILIHAQRLAAKTNETIPLGAKEVKVTADMAAKISDLAETTKVMTGVKDLSNDVINILDRAKSGEKLNENDSDILRKFVNDSKQFIEEVKPKVEKTPKPPKEPKEPKDKRIRDNVISFLDSQEAAAKERLRARGIRVSSTPLDIWMDYAIIGAAKMARGSIKFADWSAQMVKDLGEDVKPHLRNLYERASETFEQSAKKVTTHTISEAEKITEKVISGKNLAPEEADSLRSLAQKVSALSGEEKRLASQDLQAVLQELDRPGILKKISSAQTIGQLFNPKTQVRNALGNELFYRLERLNKLVATPIDIVRSKITGGDRSVTFKTNNQGEYWKSFMRGLKAGWKGVSINGLETQYDLAGQTFKSKYNPLTYMEKALGASLRSFDNAAYTRAYNNTLGEMATLRAVNEGKGASKDLIQKYIREADDNVMQIADQYGKYSTFQDNNLISVGLQKLKRGMNLGKDFGMGDLILKYPKTPGALLSRALEYSPAGFLRSAAILARPILKKEVSTSEVTQALSRAIIGTGGLSGLGFFLLDNGILTGAASKDKDVRDLQRSAGQGQYQVNISALNRLVKSGFDPAAAKIKEDDFLYTYDWLQPASMSVSVGANTAKNMFAGKQKITGLAGTAYNSIEGGLGTLTEQSVLSGLKSAAQGYPGQTVTDKIMDILSSIPSSFVPTYLNQTKQLMDNNKRETYSPNKLEQAINQAKAKIPGIEEDLPQQYDTLGDAKKTYQDNNVFNVLFNPGFSGRYKLTPEAKMIVDLITETGDETLAPRVPGKTIKIDGQTVKLDGDQFSRLQQLQGEETKERIGKINTALPTNIKVKRVMNALKDSTEKAGKNLKKEIQGK